ncbi:MAG: PHP domain-containing protein, partial [Oscillospiraceae bacterium]|nr:PHP domain-containing protein [Oscillospiraceae bacterium]
MPQQIPFFELFPGLSLPWELRSRLDGAYLTAVEIEKAARAMHLALTVRADLGDARDALAETVKSAYALEKVSIHQTVSTPASSGTVSKSSETIYGMEIKGAVQPMEGLNPKMGNVVVAGKVFFADLYETRRPGVYCLTFDMTDFKASVRVTKYLEKDEKAKLKKDIKPGMWLKVQGYVKLNRDGSDVLLDPKSIVSYPHEMRQDTAPVKRVELHAHTTFSNMDALSSLSPKAGPEGNIVRRAEAWGHPAIAITDHGVVQGFPDAWHSAKDIKILYGMEGYFVNNLDDRIAVHGEQDAPFTGEYVAFDIETTGLKVNQEAVTEIGAVVIQNGEITDRFQTFVDPGRHLSNEIIALTGITDQMLQGAPKPAEALKDFLAFVNGRPLVAHNAEFDIGFIRAGCKAAGLDFHPTYIDTLILAQNLLPELSKYKLDIVAEHLRLPAFQHHRASDDAATCGLFLPHFFQRMETELDVHSLQQINAAMPALRKKG